MIARLWRGRTKAEDAEAYRDYLFATGVRSCRNTPGNCGVHVLRRVHGGVAEFVFVSLWESREAIHAFAGDDLERAVYFPDDTRFLLEMEPNVTHYEVFAEPEAR
jgi:heme-degrading monooxygenase HmoA